LVEENEGMLTRGEEPELFDEINIFLPNQKTKKVLDYVFKNVVLK
jgi:hypothetical protein